MVYMKVKKIDKGWGYELIFASNEMYCGKILHFNKAGSRSSMHFHKEKDETWYVQSGSFKLLTINTSTSAVVEHTLNIGDIFRVIPLLPHQLEALEDNSSIVEVSTRDSEVDNFRISPGDSQQ